MLQQITPIQTRTHNYTVYTQGREFLSFPTHAEAERCIDFDREYTGLDYPDYQIERTPLFETRMKMCCTPQ